MWKGKKKRVYLDWAAASPVSSGAQAAFLDALPLYGNPGALHQEAREAKAVLETARTTIARLTEVKTDGVIFTSGATEANALAILGSVRARGVAHAHVLFHPAQHASVVHTVRMLEAEGVIVEELDMSKVKAQLRPETVLVTSDVVCGEIGTRYDTLALRRTLDSYKTETGQTVLLHVDASQAPRTESLTLAHLGADMVTLDAQKVGGVRGIGVLLLRQGITLTPLMKGGAQEGGRRPGTESPALASAFATALIETQSERRAFTGKARALREVVCAQLQSISNLQINEAKENVPHILNVSLLGRDTDYLVMLMNERGYALSTKSACESNESGSRAVLALTGNMSRATTTLRISWGPTTTASDLAHFATALISAVRFLDEKAI